MHSDQVLFGHQNDVSHSVGNNDLGDVKDVTGSVSGIFGIDSLALFGSEAGGTDAASALQSSIDYSKKAAQNGAIVTLSTHMPNFTNAKIKKNADGTYDFYNCDFNEAKDLSGDSLKKILPGGEKNEVFKAYLDTIAFYANALEKENIPVIFRPFHEDTGGWFWWGSANTAESYRSLYAYTRDYLESKGVHNMLYVYSPNGPLETEAEYMSRYPGDACVDILAFDYYNDFNTYPAAAPSTVCICCFTRGLKRSVCGQEKKCQWRKLRRNTFPNNAFICYNSQDYIFFHLIQLYFITMLIFSRKAPHLTAAPFFYMEITFLFTHLKLFRKIRLISALPEPLPYGSLCS